MLKTLFSSLNEGFSNLLNKLVISSVVKKNSCIDTHHYRLWSFLQLRIGMHMYDIVVKGFDWLGDDLIEYICKNAAKVIIELEYYGVPFS